MYKSPPITQLSGVRKRFDRGPWVLDGIDLRVEPGEFVSLIGPSGCGKSTLLRLIAGLTRATEGQIDFGAQDPARPEMAFIFQDSTLLPWLSVAANIATPLRLQCLPRAECRSIAERLAKLVHLESVLDFYPRQLSGGMQMRASLARALSTSPQILLMDEPFGALDAISRNRLNEELLAIQAREHWTGFFVTHSVNEAVFLSNRIFILSPLPSRITTEIRIDLPFPRTQQTRDSRTFQDYVVEANAALQTVLPK